MRLYQDKANGILKKVEEWLNNFRPWPLTWWEFSLAGNRIVCLVHSFVWLHSVTGVPSSLWTFVDLLLLSVKSKMSSLPKKLDIEAVLGRNLSCDNLHNMCNIIRNPRAISSCVLKWGQQALWNFLLYFAKVFKKKNQPLYCHSMS